MKTKNKYLLDSLRIEMVPWGWIVVMTRCGFLAELPFQTLKGANAFYEALVGAKS